MKRLNSDLKKVILQIHKIYGCNIKDIIRLIHATDGIGGVSFVSIKGYNSDASLQTEVADQLINVGASYENMLVKDENTLSNLNLKEIDVFNPMFDKIFSGVDTADIPMNAFKIAVKESLPQALKEMLEPKKERTSNDIWFNKALVFNTNTLRLSLFGLSNSKTVKIEGEFKKVKSKPLTVAKNIIKKFTETRTSKLRRFTMDNLNGCNLKGETLYIGGGEKMNLSGTLTHVPAKEAVK